MNPRIAAALAAAIWGTTYVTTDLLPDNPIFISAVRAFGGALPLFLIARRLPDRVWLMRSAVLGTFNCGLFFALLFVGAIRLPGGVAATLQSLVPLFTILFAWPLLGLAPSAVRVGFVLLGTMGVALLLSDGPVALDAIGVVAALGSALSSALGLVLLSRWGQPASMIALTTWQLVVAGLELSVLTWLLDDVPNTITAENIAGFAYLALIGTALAFVLWFYGIVRMDPGKVAPLVLFSPLVAFVLDAVIRGLLPSPMQSIGAALIMASVVASQRLGPAVGRARAGPTSA
jgi:probable blue pigment (indigoidine) exporter